MKRWFAFLLALTLTWSLTACGKQGNAETPDNGETPVSESAETPDDAATETPDDTVETPDNAVETPNDTVMGPEAPRAAEDEGQFTEYATHAEAEEAAGFSFGVPEEIGGYDTVRYRVGGVSLFEVIYENGNASMTARKSPGSWDASQDDIGHTVEVVETLQGVNVTCWGDGESLFLATWSADGYSYSLDASESIDRLDFLGTVETIIALNAA
ncbi:MAG: hypothetical protein IJR54_06130 [Oscillibacter sp.]|nr:hypothetical protein [Oscillibacter sp.]